MFIMCTHHLIYRPVKLVVARIYVFSDVWQAIVVFLISLVICFISAGWCERKIPWAFGKLINLKKVAQ